MNGYELSRAWFNWSFENPEKINPNHSAIYFFAIEHCNRLGWKENFGFPTQLVMDAIGIKKHQTYIKYFNDLVAWGFLKLIQKSQNQYSANIISLISAMPKSGKALDKASINHRAKQSSGIGQSNSSIIKQQTIEQQTTNNIYPTLSEVIEYFELHEYSKESACKAFEYYDCAGWKDSKGKQVKAWKQKMQGVWFKPENKKKQDSQKYVSLIPPEENKW